MMIPISASHIKINKKAIFFQHLGLCGFVLIIAFSYFILHIFQGEDGGAKSNIGNWTLLQFGLTTIIMLYLWRTSIPTNPSNIVSLYDIRWILCAGIVARIILVPVDSYTSNDIDRYLFDGRLWWEGFDPYRISHDALELQSLRKDWAPPSEHAAYVTLYPPLALSIFTLSASVGAEWAPLVWKCIATLAGIATVFVCAKILQHRQALHHISLIALSPLLILETGIGAHLDSLTTLTIAIALWLWQKERWLLFSILLGIGTLIKFLPLVLLGPVFLSLSNWRQRTILISGFSATVSLAYLLILAAGLHPIGSLSVFFEKWRFGSPLFNSLGLLFPDYLMNIIIPVLMVLAMALVGIYLIIKNTSLKIEHTINAMQITLAIPLLLSPVVFPWYLMPLLPLIALSPKIYLITWVSLAPLTYEVLGQFLCCNQWQPAAWPLWLLGIGLVISLILDLRKPMLFPSSTFTKKRDKIYV